MRKMKKLHKMFHTLFSKEELAHILQRSTFVTESEIFIFCDECIFELSVSLKSDSIDMTCVDDTNEFFVLTKEELLRKMKNCSKKPKEKAEVSV